MSDELINTCALFFFLVTLDEKIATKSSVRVISLFKQNYASDPSPLERLIKLCLQEWSLIRTQFRKEQLQIIKTKSLRWPEHLDLNPWKEFQKHAPDKELVAVTWVHVLGISESIIAKCLNQSEGTIRYRVGNGLALLGQLNRPNISSLQFS